MYGSRKRKGPVNTQGGVAPLTRVLLSNPGPEKTSAMMRCPERKSPHQFTANESAFVQE